MDTPNSNQNPQNQGQPAATPPVQPTPISVQPMAPAQAQGAMPAPAQPQTQAPLQASAQPASKPPINQPLNQQPRPVTPGTAAPVRRPPNTRKVIYGVLGFFGCSIALLILLVLIFVAQTGTNGDNPMAKALGLDTATFINTLISLVSVVFGFFSIALFIVAIIGLFRTAMARKDDKESKNKGFKQAAVSGFLLIFLVSVWVGTYLFLSSKKVAVPKATTSSIVTDPATPLGLTAPILIKFDGTKLPINTQKYEILSFLWDFGDGENSTVQSPSHTYKDKGRNNGRFDVNLTVNLKDKTTGEETSQSFTDIVTISNIKLNADFTATPDSGPAPLVVKFDASASSAPAGEIQSYEWDFNNKNVFNDGKGAKIEHTFDQAGTYTVNLRITDNTLQSTVVSKDITVAGANVPTAVISIPTTDGHYYTGTQYTFLGENSTSPTRKIVKYEWDFGDQTPKASTRTATHTYKTAGTYEVNLTATDDKGTTGTAGQKITLETPVGAALASFTTIPAQAKPTDGYITGTVPFQVQFDGSGSKEANGSIVDYKWDFNGDGVNDAAGQQSTYVYKDAGTFNATLMVVDSQNKTASTLLVVKVLPQGLQARVTADVVEGVVPLTITFDASGSSYPSGQIVSYEWDFGDGSPKRIDVSKVTYKYTQIGTFNVKVTAIASDNSKSIVTTPINVRPVPLKACFEPTASAGPAPLTIELDPRCSTGTIAKYSWDFGDGQSSKTRKPTHTFATPGSYPVKLEVSDSQNVIDTFTMNILVIGQIQ
ncbi:MAG: PKD domain-containing protein [Candidatus Gracilibacteria bacterium]|jgi:PKD repeat protein